MGAENRPIVATIGEVEDALTRVETLERKFEIHIAQLEPLINLLNPFRLIVMMSLVVIAIVGGIWHLESSIRDASHADFMAISKRLDDNLNRLDAILANHQARISVLESKTR